MCLDRKVVWLIPLIVVIQQTLAKDDDYNILRTDGSYDFGYNNPDSYHYAQANRHNLVRGEFGGRDPKTGGIDTVHYTAGPRGYRPRGKNVVRKYDLRQSGPRPVGSKDDPYFDPYEDPSYSFSFRTRTYNRDENANRVGDVNGRYSYLDDVGERHNVEFVAGKNTGFHVKTPFPDSNPRAYGPLYFRGRGKPIPRGRTSVQRGLDGSYKFVSAGPDQRRTETSDATGHVRGSYTYLDDKGVQHSVHYIAGPEIGYRVLKNVKGPHLPSVFPFQHPDIIPPDFYDEPDIFNAAASGNDRKPSGRPDFGDDEDEFNKSPKPRPRPRPRPGGNRFDDDSFGKKKPPQAAFGDEDDGYDTDFGDLFGGKRGGGGSKEEGQGGRGGGFKGGPSTPPSSGSTKPSVFNKPGASEEDSSGISKENSSGASKENDPFKHPKNGFYIPPEATKPFEMPKDSSEEDYGFGHKKTTPADYGDNYGRPSDSKPPKPKPPVRGRPGSARPTVSSEEDENFSGLFGSESNRPRPPYVSGGGDEGGTSVINLGGPNRYCPKCEGAVLTNVGDTYLSVPPGVSVRAHVQAINLLPYSSRFPNPSEQLKAEVGLKTEQLNANKDTIVDRNVIESNDIDKMGGVYSKTERQKSSTEKVSIDEKTTTEIVPTTIRRII